MIRHNHPQVPTGTGVVFHGRCMAHGPPNSHFSALRLGSTGFIQLLFIFKYIKYKLFNAKRLDSKSL